MAKGKTATPIVVKENNKVIITTPPPIELVVVGDHLEFDKSATERGVVVGGI